MVKDNPSVWSRKLDDALWVIPTAYKTPVGTTPYRLLYVKMCHLPIKIKHRAYWTLRRCNPDPKITGEKRFLQLHELDEWILQDYKNSKPYKARTKAYHDKKLRIRKEFKAKDKEELNELSSEEVQLMCEKGNVKAIPFMAPFPKDYRKIMPWALEKGFIYSVVENVCNEAKLYDMDKTGKGIVRENILYMEEDSGEEVPLEEI
ncbi:reverse transcriptase domain-containing protein [Tanacetum coccineum]|uniref:Reverse transcriptase domain-containing protein n=1 Tax=Tanacetum coccineum TaxID=301880 RepID=A0ABQ5BAB0_9ASTR